MLRGSNLGLNIRNSLYSAQKEAGYQKNKRKDPWIVPLQLTLAGNYNCAIIAFKVALGRMAALANASFGW